MAEILAYPAAAWPTDDDLPPQLAEKRRDVHQRHVEGTRRFLEKARDRGPAPWDGSQFVFASTLGRDHDIGVTGRDFYVPASPEGSLSWFDQVMGSRLEGRPRERALEALRSFEADRKALLQQFVRELLKRCPDAEGQEAADAYVIADGELYLLRRNATAALDRFFRDLERIDEDINKRIDQLLGH